MALTSTPLECGLQCLSQENIYIQSVDTLFPFDNLTVLYMVLDLPAVITCDVTYVSFFPIEHNVY